LPVVASKRFYLIVGVIALIVILGVAAAANSAVPKKIKPTPTPTPITIIPTATPGPPATLSFTIKATTGLAKVTVTNQNSGATITLTAADLPATFNCKYGDTLTFHVTPQTGYRFNAWVFGDNTFQSQNPYSTKITYSFQMEARFLMEAQTG
jgi:hypothetical protein